MVKTLGQRGEAAAAAYLKRLGYKIVARSERGAIGELDIVAIDLRGVRGPTACFSFRRSTWQTMACGRYRLPHLLRQSRSVRESGRQ